MGGSSRRLMAFLSLLRPPNCLMMGLAVLVGEILTAGGLEPLPSLLGFSTAFFLTGASMTVNDYFDRFVDEVNQPGRPLPSGLVSAGEALLFASVLAAAGLLSAAGSWVERGTPLPLVVAALSFLLSSYYNARGKRTGLPGNLMVSTCVAVPFLYGPLVLGESPTPALSFFLLMAFLSNTGREILKGMADVEGDRRRGIRTLAVSRGPAGAAPFVLLFYASAVALSPLPLLLGEVSLWYLPPVAVADLGFLVAGLLSLRDPSPGRSLRLKRLSLLWMLFGLLAFLLGRLG
ncbi:MAG: UbiA family prenyltransferase [Hadesarchaea archaeon]|jgi:geranylgeranylglycerol-phosphate geranylgeranyltransferase|nr:UbiA family prenyltransferase [Hadesarchaea archaeon]